MLARDRSLAGNAANSRLFAGRQEILGFARMRGGGCSVVQPLSVQIPCLSGNLAENFSKKALWMRLSGQITRSPTMGYERIPC
jgi:hypothetical protein